MNEVSQRALQAYFKELAILLAAIEANLDLQSYLVQDLLSGEDSDLSQDKKAFADAVTEVLHRSGLSAIDCLCALQDQVHLLSPDDQVTLIAMTGRYRELTERWTALVEAMQHA